MKAFHSMQDALSSSRVDRYLLLAAVPPGVMLVVDMLLKVFA